MNSIVRILTFGALSGLVWSIAPGVLFEFFISDIPGTLFAGVVSGITTSAVLASFVTRVGWGVAVLFGVISLPLGAFIFGCTFAAVTRAVVDSPWTLGVELAVFSVISIFALAFFPLSVITTLLFRTFILRGKRPNAV